MIMRNLLIITDDLIIGGGAQRFTSIIATSLSEKFNVSILTFYEYKNRYPFKGKYYSLKENLGFFVKVINSLRINEIIRPFRIYKRIKRTSPDIIISITDFTNVFTIVTKLIFRIKIPLIISVRSNPVLKYKETNRIFNFLINILYPLKVVNKIVTVSKRIQEILEKNYGIKQKKLKTINNGIEIEKIREFKNENIENYKDIFSRNNLIKFITIGRLVNIKGHKYLIEAFYKVKMKIPNSILLIIGDGPLKFELKALIRKKRLENDIILLGMQENPYKYLAQSDIFVLSSLLEGFPNVLIEALACGLPIISTNCESGPNEILDNNRYGLLTKVMDSEDLAKKMIYLAKNNELMTKYSKLSLKRAKDFNQEKILGEWLNLIEDLLK